MREERLFENQGDSAGAFTNVTLRVTARGG